MLISWILHDKSNEVSIKTRSTPASLLFKGQTTKPTAIKWPTDIDDDMIVLLNLFCICQKMFTRQQQYD